MSWIVELFLLLLILVISNEIFRRSKVSNFLVFVLFPLIMIPIWWNVPTNSTFKWIKLVAVLLGVLIINLIRYSKLRSKREIYPLMIFVLGINMIIPAFAMFSVVSLPTFLNSVSGILLVLALNGKQVASIGHSGKKEVFFSLLDWQWLIIYSLWDLLFVFLLFPHAALKHVVILGIPLVLEYFRKGSYLQTRAYTLGFYLILLFTFGDFFSQDFLVGLQLDNFVFVFSVIVLGLSVFYFANFLMREMGKE